MQRLQRALKERFVLLGNRKVSLFQRNVYMPTDNIHPRGARIVTIKPTGQLYFSLIVFSTPGWYIVVTGSLRTPALPYFCTFIVFCNVAFISQRAKMYLSASVQSCSKYLSFVKISSFTRGCLSKVCFPRTLSLISRYFIRFLCI